MKLAAFRSLGATRHAPHLLHQRQAAASRSTASRNIAAAATTKWLENSAPSTKVKNSSLGIHINSHYNSANIEVISLSDPANIRVAMHPDPYCEVDKAAHMQWFNFRVTGAKGTPLVIHLVNAGKASFPVAWDGYQTAASYDLDHWFRTPTTYNAESGVLTWTITPDHDAVQFAFFAPYTHEQHFRLIHRMQVKPAVKLHEIGTTLDGHDIELLQVGEDGPDKCKVWVTCRQHPGETQAEWFAEGLLERLTDPHDSVSRKLLQNAVLFVIPNLCPDGSWRGHLRTNAAGVNLNRAWANPDLDNSPEVFHTLEAMEQYGVDIHLDIHGDEELPYVFIAGNEGIPRWDARLKGLQDAFSEAFVRSSPCFQTKMGYPVDEPGEANMMVASSAVGERFNALSVTLEMPFKDDANMPDLVQGWCPEKCKNLGASILTAINEVVINKEAEWGRR